MDTKEGGGGLTQNPGLLLQYNNNVEIPQFYTLQNNLIHPTVSLFPPPPIVLLQLVPKQSHKNTKKTFSDH